MPSAPITLALTHLGTGSINPLVIDLATHDQARISKFSLHPADLSLGYIWHLKLFQVHYKNLGVYRDDMIIPLGLFSMVIQAFVYSYIYSKMFAGLPVLEGALKFAGIAFPLSVSYMALAAAAKHHMTSPTGYILIETCFVFVHFLVVSPLIACVYRTQS